MPEKFWRQVAAEYRARRRPPASPSPGPLAAAAAGGLSPAARRRLGELLADVPHMAPGSRENGRALADLLRTGSPHPDAEIMPYVLGILDVLEAFDARAPEAATVALAQALAFAALDLTALDRADCPADGGLLL